MDSGKKFKRHPCIRMFEYTSLYKTMQCYQCYIILHLVYMHARQISTAHVRNIYKSSCGNCELTSFICRRCSTSIGKAKTEVQASFISQRKLSQLHSGPVMRMWFFSFNSWEAKHLTKWIVFLILIETKVLYKRNGTLGIIKPSPYAQDTTATDKIL